MLDQDQYNDDSIGSAGSLANRSNKSNKSRDKRSQDFWEDEEDDMSGRLILLKLICLDMHNNNEDPRTKVHLYGAPKLLVVGSH